MSGVPQPPSLRAGAGAVAPRAAATSRTGLIYGIGACTIWGFAPIYFSALEHVPPWLIVSHRIFWSVLFLVVIIWSRREWNLIWPILKEPRNLLLLAAGAILIAANWLIFIYAVTSHQVLQASLGYFINPLLSITLGMVFLHERLRGWQWVAVLFAAAAVANLSLRGTGLPWISVSLAGSFGLYGLVRKKVNINSLHSLLIESVILLPVAMLVIASRPLGHSLGTFGLLSLSGIITAVPLLLFGAAVRRLQLSTLGFLQYIGPSLQFVLAIVLFREPLDRVKMISFILCWLAIAVDVADSVLTHRPQAVANEPE